MISEHSFANSFSSFWTEFFPMLTPSFVSIINECYEKRLKDIFGKPLNTVSKNPSGINASIVSEYAFFIVKIAIDKKVKVNKILLNEQLIKLAGHNAIKIISQYEGTSEYKQIQFTKEDLDEIKKLALNYENFLDERSSWKNIEINPIIPGAGFLSQCKADLSIEDTLFEVKTVNRNIASKDIKQLIVYLALQFATGERRWKKAGFFNPRKAVYHEFFVDNIIYKISGKPTIEVFQDFIDYVCKRDIEIDIAF
jgi:hypothetical protein